MAHKKRTLKINNIARPRKIIAHLPGADITTEKSGAIDGRDTAG
jgi:hypothetical protein